MSIIFFFGFLFYLSLNNDPYTSKSKDNANWRKEISVFKQCPFAFRLAGIVFHLSQKSLCIDSEQGWLLGLNFSLFTVTKKSSACKQAAKHWARMCPEGQEQLGLLEALQSAGLCDLQANYTYSSMYVNYLHIQFYKLFQRGISIMLLSKLPSYPLQDEEIFSLNLQVFRAFFSPFFSFSAFLFSFYWLPRFHESKQEKTYQSTYFSA